jgi:RNA polymerase sigma-70 factor (ECF subfamily)
VTNGASDTDHLLNRAATGDPFAREELLMRHRERLNRLVAVRFDRRLAARVDPSDIVQETLADAAMRLDQYLANRPMAYYPWLRRLALDRLDKTYRRHTAVRRTVRREEQPALPEDSAFALAERLMMVQTDPVHAAQRNERKAQVRRLLDQLPDGDREVLVLRFLEQLSSSETADVLGITSGAVRLRMMRALKRLRSQLGEDSLGGHAS